MLAPTGQLFHELNPDGGLSHAAGAADERDHSAGHTAVQHFIQFRNARSDDIRLEGPHEFLRRELGENLHALVVQP